MKWKFWEKDLSPETGNVPKTKKTAKPKDLPFSVGRYLVAELNCDPDWVWSLKSISTADEGKKKQFKVLVFSQETAAGRGIGIHNADDLAAHPELILFEGRYEKDMPNVEVTAVQKALLRVSAA